MLSTKDKKAAVEFYFNDEAQIYFNFLQYTTQSTNAIEYTQNFIKNNVLSTLESSCIEYVDIGCGYGNKTIPIIDFIKQYRAVSATAIDPSNELLSIFIKQSEDKEIKFVCSTWEEYEIINKFHLITSIHTFYYIDDWEAAIIKMLDSLHSNGVICISIRCNDYLYKFKNHFSKKLFKNAKLERSFEDLQFLMDKIGLKYKTDFVESQLNIEECLADTERGKNLIEFLLQIPYQKIPDYTKKDIIKYIKQHQNNGYLTHNDGFLWISL
jgi:SAM-dependent methyltransferase